MGFRLSIQQFISHYRSKATQQLNSTKELSNRRRHDAGIGSKALTPGQSIAMASCFGMSHLKWNLELTESEEDETLREDP